MLSSIVAQLLLEVEAVFVSFVSVYRGRLLIQVALARDYLVDAPRERNPLLQAV